MQVRFHEMQDLEINSCATEAGWSNDWMMVCLQPKGKALRRPPAINNASILSHVAPTPARAVPVPEAVAARPNDGNSTGVIAEGHSATVVDANVTAVPDVDGPRVAPVDDGGSAVADGHRAAVADAVSGDGQSAGVPEESLAQQRMICHNEMVESEQELRALSCGHMEHSECVNTYMEVSSKTLDESCPYRCHQSIRAIMAPL